MDEINILVNLKEVDGRYNVSIMTPPNQDKLSVDTTAHILVSAISLLVKGCSHNDTGIKDYMLMNDIIKHLNMEFSSNDSFADVKLFDDFKPKP